jgi:hypothetical protein
MKATFWAVAVCIAFAGGLVAVFLSSSESPAPAQKPQDVLEKPVCDVGGPVTGRVLVGAENIPMMKGPGRNKGRVINERASETTRRPYYREVSFDYDLDSICETKDWILVKIVGADGGKVSWESGWIEKRYLVTELTPDRQLGLFWDILNSKEVPRADKAWVREGALKVLADDKKCARIAFGGRDFKRSGYYFVSCRGPGGETSFDVSFQKTDVTSEAPLKAPPPPVPFNEMLSRQMCEAAITKQANFPSTVDIKRSTGYGTRTTPIGNRETIQIFSAKNAFGLELTYVARCIIEPNGKLEINISEQR